MNFFEHQDRARRKTVYLIFLFAIAIIGMILGLYLVVAIAVIMQLDTPVSLWQPDLLVLIAIAVLLIVGGGSLTKLFQLRAGGKVVAWSMGGRLVKSDTHDWLEQRLLNVVEEMAIASGTSVPPVYVMDYEPGINAFAAGFTINDAVIGVTKGCLEELSRDQLQGVIAHEFSHIIHGDMRLNLYLIGVLQGILLIHIIGRETLQAIGKGTRSKRNKQSLIVIAALAMLAIGYVGFLCGRMIKSAIGRQREFLADASAVQYTRNPMGISGALRKIGNIKDGSKIKASKAEEASHLFFGEAVTSFDFSQLFATHPPLTERIERLENLPSGALQDSDSPSNLEQDNQPETQVAQLIESEAKMGFQETEKIQVQPDSIITEIGTTDSAHVRYAHALMNQFPEAIKTSLKEQQGSQALIYGLLLNFQDKSVRDRQIAHIKETESSELCDRLWQIYPYVQDLNPRHRLPLVDLTIPLLRELSETAYLHLSKQIETLIQADGKLSLSEYTLKIVLIHRLAPYFNPSQAPKILYANINVIWNDCVIILSGLAKIGNRDRQDANNAFRAGMQRLPKADRKTIPDRIIPTNITSISRSLNRLMTTTPKLKQTIVEACAYTVLLDGEVRVQEAELLRTIIITLDCPIPPFLEKSYSH